MFLLRYVRGAWPGNITLCSLLGGRTLSFGTFREKRKKTLTRNGEHSVIIILTKRFVFSFLLINTVLGACVECIITHAFWVVFVVVLRGQVLTLDGRGVLRAGATGGQPAPLASHGVHPRVGRVY